MRVSLLNEKKLHLDTIIIFVNRVMVCMWGGLASRHVFIGAQSLVTTHLIRNMKSNSPWPKGVNDKVHHSPIHSKQLLVPWCLDSAFTWELCMKDVFIVICSVRKIMYFILVSELLGFQHKPSNIDAFEFLCLGFKPIA